MELDPVALDAVVDLVRLFSKAIDLRDLDVADVIVRQDAGEPAHILIPDHLEVTAKDMAALATGHQPGDMSAGDVATYLREFSELVGELWGSAPHLELTSLLQLLETHGVSVERPAPVED
jgi:hypothetical protein